MSVWRKVGWSSSRQSWEERLAAFTLLLAGAVTFWYGGRLALSRQIILWSILLIALAFVLRRGWIKLFGPILFYDVLRTSRRGRYHLVRFLYSLLILVVFYFLYEEWTSFRQPGGVDIPRFAEAFFLMFMMMQFGAVFLLTPPFAAGAITEEKERLTLEFLLATDLRNREIIFGKLLARIGNLTLLLLAGLPMLGFVQFLGGVDPDLVLAGFAAVLVSMFSLAAVSILCSVYARKSLNALLLTYVVVAFYLMTTAMAQALYAFPRLMSFNLIDSVWTVTVDDLIVWLSAGSLPVALYKIGNAWRGTTALANILPDLLRDYAIFHGTFGLICLTWAVLRLRRVALQENCAAAAKTGRIRHHRPIGRWPMLWKELHAEPGFRITWLGVIGLVIITIVGLAPPVVYVAECFLQGFVYVLGGLPGLPEYEWSRFIEKMNTWVKAAGTSLACLMLLITAVRTATSVTSERARFTLDSLLTAPLSTRDILFAKLTGGVFCMRWLWLWMGTIAALGLLTDGLQWSAAAALLVGWLIYAAFFAALGLCCSVYCRSSFRAIVAALSAFGVTLSLPWIIFIPLGILVNKYLGSHVSELHTYVDFFSLLSPPVWIAFMAHPHGVVSLNARQHFFFGEELDAEARWCAWIAVLLFALLTVLIWEIACRRFDREAGRRPKRPSAAPVAATEASAPVPSQAL